MCQLVPSLKLPCLQNLQYLGYDMPLNLYVTHKMPVWCAFYWNSSGSLVCLDNKECHSLYLNVQFHYKSSSPLKYLTSWIYLVHRAGSFTELDCSWPRIIQGLFLLFLLLWMEWNGMKWNGISLQFSWSTKATNCHFRQKFAPWDICQQTG